MFVTVLISLCVITKGFKRISDHNAEKEGTIRVCLSVCVFRPCMCMWLLSNVDRVIILPGVL